MLQRVLNPAFSAQGGSSRFTTLSFANSNGVSFSNSNGSIVGSIAAGGGAFSAQGGSSTFNTLNFVNTNGVSFSNSNGSLYASVQTNYLTSQSNQAFSAPGGSSAFQTLNFANSNGVSFSNSNGSVVATVATNYLTTAGLSQDSSKYAGTNGAITGGAITVNTSGVSISLPAYLTTAMASNAVTISNINVSAGSTSNNLSALTFSNGSNISFGLNGSVITASVATSLSNIKISAGTSSANLSALTFTNSNGVSWSLNGSNIIASVSTYPLPATLSYYENEPFLGAGTTTFLPLQSTSHVIPFYLPNYLSASYIRLLGSFSAQSSSGLTTGNTTFTNSHLLTFNCVVYSLGIGASSNSLQSVASGSAGFTQANTFQANNNGSEWSFSQNITYPSLGFTTNNLQTGFATTEALTFEYRTTLLTDLTGPRYFDIPFANSLSPGNYWVIYGISSTTSNNGPAAFSQQRFLITNYGINHANIAFGPLGVPKLSSNALVLGIGSYTLGGGGTTASLDLSAISSSASHLKMNFQMIRQV